MRVTALLEDGNIVAITDDGEDRMCREPITGPTEETRIDPDTNAEFVEALLANPFDFRLVDGSFVGPEGESITINPPGIRTPFGIRLRKERAEGDARTISGWAMWTEQEALAWYQENIADPLAAVPDIDTLTDTQYRNNAQAIDAQWQAIITAQALAIRNLARMVIALRNKTWPELEGET